VGRTCYKERKLRTYKKDNACNTGKEKKEGRPRMRWMDGWCGEGFAELGLVN
jgi:hypothetical protein